MADQIKVKDVTDTHSGPRAYGLQTPGSKGVAGKKRYAMVIDLRRCIGCQSCVVACKAEFGVALGVWRTWVKVADKGRYPNTRRIFMPRLCNHCDYPVCVRNWWVMGGQYLQTFY